MDIPGNIGYNPWPSGNIVPPVIGESLPNSGTNYQAYTARFGGTSAACPQVAGVAALVLSLNPNLTNVEVFNLIATTADKVGGYAYNNNVSSEMGYGRLNAYNAARAAYRTLCTTPRGLVLVGKYTQASTGIVTTLANNSNPVVEPGLYYIDITPLNSQSYSPTNAIVNPWLFGDFGGHGAYNQNNNLRGVVNLQPSSGTSVNISAFNPCDQTASFFFRLSATSSYRLAASPNPSDDELTVELIPKSPATVGAEFSEEKPAFRAELYSNYGVLVRTQISHQGKSRINTRDLPAGLYTLRAGAGTDVFSEHIQIIH
jgi:hypothetical protein